MTSDAAMMTADGGFAFPDSIRVSLSGRALLAQRVATSGHRSG
jgi:hypothetical protein